MDLIMAKVFREIKLEDFVNYDELKESSYDISEEQKEENFEMTE